MDDARWSVPEFAGASGYRRPAEKGREDRRAEGARTRDANALGTVLGCTERRDG
ncbi:MAG TPA: hypothetical protein PLY91_01460 [Methanoregulaceae archaeon]|nr:hypothetical protein [Methanoregulaceae archaeon]